MDRWLSSRLSIIEWAVSIILITNFEVRHDQLSTIRQRRIAGLLLWTNAALAAILWISVQAWRWQSGISHRGFLVMLTVWAASLVLLGLSSGIPDAVTSYLDSASGGPIDPITRSPQSWDRARKYLYYPGSCLNFIAIAILVEQSGGLLRSPFSSVLLGMVLAAQQLGRYRTNSALFVVFGALLTAAMGAWEGVHGAPRPEDPPSGLLFFILVVSFATAAVFTHVGKPPNPRVSRMDTSPQLVELYAGADGVWRYVLHGRPGRLDSTVPGVGAHAPIRNARLAVESLLANGPEHGSVVSVTWRSFATTEDLGHIGERNR